MAKRRVRTEKKSSVQKKYAAEAKEESLACDLDWLTDSSFENSFNRAQWLVDLYVPAYAPPRWIFESEQYRRIYEDLMPHAVVFYADSPDPKQRNYVKCLALQREPVRIVYSGDTAFTRAFRQDDLE